MSVTPDSPEEAPSPRHPNAVLAEYLSNRIPEYRELVELRREGWNNPSADAHFARERQHADNPSASAKDAFYKMTCAIGAELNTTVPNALRIPPSSHPPAILDMCLAPGGFASTALALNPTATLHGITLPPAQGGYDVRIPGWRTHPRVAAIHFLDVTMLAGEMGVEEGDIPTTHPDARRFIHTTPLPPAQKFDLVFCGGTVVRNHTRAEYRQWGGREGTRLLTSQLVLALGRIREGGTLVVVMHRADKWGTVRVVRAIRGFCAEVRLFKPGRAHAKKSSFYLVARGVRVGDAGEAVEGWKGLWKAATFGRGVGEGGEGSDGEGGGDGDEGEVHDEGEAGGEDVGTMLEEFGEELVRLTTPVFKIQAKALRTASYMR